MVSILRRNIGFIVFSTLLLIVFLSLGFWQIERLGQKQALLAAIENTNQEPLDAMTLDWTQIADRAYWRARAAGTLDFTKPIFIPGKINPNNNGELVEDRMGYALYLPLRGANRTILLNYGWVSQTERADILAQAGNATAKPIQAEGVLQPAPGKSRFMPDNNPVAHNWYWFDWPELAAYAGYKIAPIVLYNNIDRSGAARPPISQNISNNHRQYAITWFSLALVQLLATLFYLKRKGSFGS